MRKHWIFSIFISMGLLLGLMEGFRLSLSPASTAQKDEKGKITDRVLDLKEAQTAAIRMLDQRFKALFHGTAEDLKDNYFVSELGGQYAFERENKRVKYLNLWLKARGVVLKEARATYEVDSVEEEGPNRVWLEVTELAVYSYQYPPGNSQDKSRNEPSTRPLGQAPILHTFGSRTAHVMELISVDGKWKIARDWYQDPLGNEAWDPPDDVSLRQTAVEGIPQEEKSFFDPSVREKVFGTQRYQRDKAVEYAKKHSGVRSLPDGGRYNPKFRVYTYLGGDCANFVSQVLQAGGMSQGQGWLYSSEGSTAWVQGESLVWYLLASGKGVRLARGGYQDVVKPGEDLPDGYVGALEPGDVIGYETKGQITHVAVVVGKDPKGYITIASHTVDRLYFPWDLGWDKRTVFWLIKIVW